VKRQIDLEKAAVAEAFGALAVRAGSDGKSRNGAGPMTAAQRRCLSELARSMVQLARDAGARKKRVILGDLSLELRGSGTNEVLFVRAAASRRG
jgi:hypothetical protein